MPKRAKETDFSQDIEKCLEVLQKGGVILYPTDTIWGIGCDATNAASVEKIIALKKRQAEKSFVVMVTSQKEILQHAAAPDLAIFDYLQTLDKPTTVIYDHALGFAENIPAEDGSVAIRICDDEFCTHLIRRFRKPLVSTSANISGKPAPRNFSEIGDEILQNVDYIVRYKQDDVSTARASSIIKWENGKVTVIRE